MKSVTPIRSEAEIIAAILAGEAQFYQELIRPHERSVYMMAPSYMKNEADAEDVAQEAFIKAFRNLSKFRGDAKFSTWLISITLNEARNRLRRQRVVRMQSFDETRDEDGAVSPALLRDRREIPSEAVEREDARTLIKKASNCCRRFTSRYFFCVMSKSWMSTRPHKHSASASPMWRSGCIARG